MLESKGTVALLSHSVLDMEGQFWSRDVLLVGLLE